MKLRGRLFRFFLWNDMHMRGPQVHPRHPGYPGCNEKALWALECAQGRHELETPDFVASAGDIVDGEIADDADDFHYARRFLLAPLPVPFLPCVGNHENGQGEGIPDKNRSYDHWFGPQWHNYLFTCAGIGFIVVDTSGAHRIRDGVTAARHAFVERAFEKLGVRPTCVITHVPLIAMRQEDVLKASFGFSTWRVLDTGMLEIIESHAEQVIAVCSGHIHLTSVRQQKGIWHLMSGGTCGYPSDFISFDVFPDSLRFQMHAAPERYLNPNGNIHGRPRHPGDFTDREHPTHETYLWGNAGEREGALPLEGLKRPALTSERSLVVWHEIGPGQWRESCL